MSLSVPFADQLVAYKQSIDEDIASYSSYIKTATKQQYGAHAALEMNVFLDMLGRGGKRIRGALVVVGYEMSGGKNRAMILQAARAIEMLHAYMLILDDIQDRSLLRRGKPTAHEMFATYHRTHQLKGDAVHFGISMAINAAVAGAHAAEAILANMDADPQLRLNVLSIVNRTLAITAHGQTGDMMNSVVNLSKEIDIDRVLEWKTALYTFINPLHVGMVLAGADCRATDAITPYALHTGKAFQITDDLLGIFGEEATLGKVPGEDIKEGKATLLIHYALKRATPSDATFLRRCLGNPKLTQKDFARCQAIIQDCGASQKVRAIAQNHLEQALRALDDKAAFWPDQHVVFLRQLALALDRR